MFANSHVADLVSVFEHDRIHEEEETKEPELNFGMSILPPGEEEPTAEPQVIAGKPIQSPYKGLRQADLVALLQHPTVSPTLLAFEKTTGLDRVLLAYGLLFALPVYLVLGPGASVASNLIGFAYPAFASFKAIRTKEKEDDTRWLIYWSAFTAVYIVDSLIVPWASLYSGYWVLKSAFFVYLWLPQTQGALLVYTLLVDPTVSLFDRSLKKYLN